MTDIDVEQLRAELERVRSRPCAQCDTRDQVADADVLAAEVRTLRATLTRVETLTWSWRRQSKRSYGSSYADGAARALGACADQLRAALRGEP